MTGRYLTDLADVLRAAGLTVTEQDGWQTRARGSGGYANGRPSCVMWHHAASAPNASAESVASYASYGSEKAPVCNLVLGRDGGVIVCAAGATNTNGKGGPWQLSSTTVPIDEMNTHAIGVEAVNTGVGEIWPAEQLDSYFALTIACAQAYGFKPQDCLTHAEWRLLNGSKIDPARADAVEGLWRPRSLNSSGTWHGDDIRSEAVLRATSTQPPPQEDQIMFVLFDCLGNVFGGYMDVNGIAAQVTWLSPSRAAACLDAGAEHLGELSPTDMANCDLLGPLPPGVPASTFANVIG